MVSSALTGGGSLQMRARLVVRPKAGTVPANDRLRPDNRNRAQGRRETLVRASGR
jgi:hypothetical protein